MDESLIGEVWDIFKDYIPDKNKDIAASQYVDFLLGKDIELEDLENFLGYDPTLDTAINAVLEEEAEFDDEEDDDYGNVDDEEY